MSDPIYKMIGTRIRSVRKARNITQKDFAMYLGVSQSTICNIEKGIYPVPVHVLTHMAKILMVSFDCLLTEEDLNASTVFLDC